MKFFSKLLFLSILFLPLQSICQDTAIIDTVIVQPNLEDVANEVIDVLTNDSTGVLELPGVFDPTNSESLFEWWMFIFALLMPLGTWVLHKVWPSSTKSQLILKSTSIAVIVLLIIVFAKGASIAVIGQAVIAFLMKVVGYKNFLKPFAKSPRLRNYDSSK